jgi:hypothetical protein
MVYSRAERVFILEHYFTSKSFIAAREAFGNACPDKEVLNKKLVTNLGTQEVFVCVTSAHRAKKIIEITAIPISSSASAVTTRYGCKNLILPLI